MRVADPERQAEIRRRLEFDAGMGAISGQGAGAGVERRERAADAGVVFQRVEAGKKSDAQTVAMASGKANVMDVVTAVAETDVAVSTLVSVRDRVIQSYEDIMKMPI